MIDIEFLRGAQSALLTIYGNQGETRAGESTLSISRDRCEVTDEQGKLAAQTVEECAEMLSKHPD